MPVLIDMLYREYCRARLAEMRKQLFISRASDKPGENLESDRAEEDRSQHSLDQKESVR